MDNVVGTIAQQLLTGATQGCLYALIAIGYTLIFGVLRVIFFAQGELSMVGAFAATGAAIFLRAYAPGYLVLPGSLVAGVSVPIAVGVLVNSVAIRPLRDADRTKQLVASVGVSLVLQNLMMLTVSSQAIPFPRLVPDGSWWVGQVHATSPQLAILITAPVVMAIVTYQLFGTQLGLRIRAVAENPSLARAEGIRVGRTSHVTFVLASAVAGVAGFLMATYDGVIKYDMGFLPGIKGFTAAILGGFGNPKGAMLGGLVLGLLEALAAGYVSNAYKDTIAFAALVAILISRPGGLVQRSAT